jgi:hypothetical protein
VCGKARALTVEHAADLAEDRTAHDSPGVHDGVDALVTESDSGQWRRSMYRREDDIQRRGGGMH